MTRAGAERMLSLSSEGFSLRLAPALAAFCVLLAGAPARAQSDPGAAARKQFLAAQKAALPIFRTALRGAALEASSAIGSVELAFAGNLDATAAGDALFAALVVFQVDVAAALVAAADAQSESARDALATLGTGLGGIYPQAFYTGDLSPAASFEDGVEKEIAKTYTKLRKRVDRLGSRFQDAGFGLTFRIRPPHPFKALTWDETAVDSFRFFPATLDLALGWSDLGATGDAQLRIGGSAGVVEVIGLEDVTIFATNKAAEQTVTATPVDDRFATNFGGASLPEGNWIAGVTQSSLLGDEISIGVR